MPPKPRKVYRACVGIALFNREGCVFVGERTDCPGAWQMPQGGIDPHETISEAVRRELQEEIGTDAIEILEVHPHILRYDLPPDLARRLWNGVYCGQEQTWVAARFMGQDTDIDIRRGPLVEFRAWRWMPLVQVPALIVPFKRAIYETVVAMFAHYT